MAKIIDLTLTLEEGLRGFEIETAKTLEEDGWNATTLKLYSHCGTHMDAPRHFLPDGATIDQQVLSACIGPARIVDLTRLEPRELITVSHLESLETEIGPGARLLLRTDWQTHVHAADYRTHFPRVSAELAQWLVDREVALLGVEPPSVADVGDLEELTAVHRILLGGGVVIVEGLAHLDQIRQPVVHFIALPLKVKDGDGTPVRAVAIEDNRGGDF